MITFHKADNGDTERIRNAAHRDGAAPVASTHFMTKDDEIVGALSIGAVTQVFAWIRRDLKIRDSVKMEKFIERAVAEHVKKLGLPPVFSVLVDKPSRLNPLMTKVGYVPFGEVNLFIKPL